MKSLYESIKDSSIKQIIDFIKSSDGFCDEDVPNYISLLSKYVKKNAGLKQNDYKTFFDKHGLSKLNWGRKNDAIKQFVNLFSDNDNLDTLNEIVKQDGIISINDLNDTGNLFKYCKGFEDEAKTIASWTNSTSANSGPCEMLLKFILKEGTTVDSGDVGIQVDIEKTEEMEVKAGTVSKGSTSGGHAAGQKGNIRKAWSIYWHLDHNLFGLDTPNSEADKLQYFQNENGFAEFVKKLKDNNLLENPRAISDAVVEALEFQYNFITNESEAKSTLKTEMILKDTAYDQFSKIIKKDSISSFKEFRNVIGCIQLYLYSQIEGFNYFIVVMIEKDIDKETPSNGFYFLLKDCKTEHSGLLDFNKVLRYLSFDALDSATSSQGRTGKIKFIKNKQKNVIYAAS